MGTIISWTDETWNPTTGCSHVSEGCRHCYAEALSTRYGWTSKPWSAQNISENIKLHPDRLRKPYTWKEPKRVFVNSMSDLFHPAIPDDFIRRVFQVMNDLTQHTFQILTKRPERMATWPGLWTSNIWAGTSIENRNALSRLKHLQRCQAKILFLSCEPLIESLGTMDLTSISWVIVGGESGNGYRPMDHAWAREIRDQCVARDIRFFFKQSSAMYTERGTELIESDGSRTIWQQYPEIITEMVQPTLL